jgi:putative hydrolase of the HAD superfamily
MRSYDAIFLDAQGTLLQAHPSVSTIYADVCRNFGRKASLDEVAAATSEIWAELKRSMDPSGSYDTSDEATRDWWNGFNTRLYYRLGMSGDLDGFLGALWDSFGRPENWRLFPDVEGVLVELRARGYHLGMVSNWDSRLFDICRELGISPHFDFLLASAATGMEKPDRRIFQAALRKAKVPANRAIHVGDDYEADVLGARGAGIHAVLLDRDGKATANYHPVIRSLQELLEMLP